LKVAYRIARPPINTGNLSGAYIIKHGDLAGFSQQDQNLLSTLVQAHRGKIPVKNLKDLPAPWNDLAIYMIIILRLAVILRRNRSNSAIPEFNITLAKKLFRSRSVKFRLSGLSEACLFAYKILLAR
jgi:exopolyphosphatase/pppGpp-phosphohydrolase